MLRPKINWPIIRQTTIYGASGPLEFTLTQPRYYATTYVIADGLTNTFSFSFAGVNPDTQSGTVPYLYPEDVRALEMYTDADGVKVAEPRTVILNSPNKATIVGTLVPAGHTVKIYRQTEIRFPLVDYRDGQSVSDVDLDLSNRQAVFIAQETLDAATGAMGLDRRDNYDARGRRVVNLAEGVDGSDAVTLGQMNTAVADGYGRTLRTPASEPQIAEIPEKAARAGRLLSFNNSGDPVVTAPAGGSATELAMLLASEADGEGGDMVAFNAVRTLRDKGRDVVSLADFCDFNDGVALCDSAAAAAEVLSNTIYVPAGVWRFSTPMAHAYKTQFFGPGVLKYDKAEWWRRGGSAGAGLADRYTLMYEFVNQSDVYVLLNGVAQPIVTWLGPFTFLGPESTTTDTIRYGVINGTLQLTGYPESPRAFNMMAGGGGKVLPNHPDEITQPAGYNNTGFGARALQNVKDAGNNTALGSRSLTSLQSGGNNTALGFQAMWRGDGVTDNTAVGSVALEWNISGSYNTAVGVAAAGGNETGNYNTAVGSGAGGDMRDGDYNTSLGYFAHGNNSTSSPVDACTSVGAFANRYGRGGGTVSVGYRALAGNGPTTGNSNVGIGFFAGRNIVDGAENVIIGTGAAGNSSSMNLSRGTIVGMEAGANCNSDDIVAVGYRSLNAITSAIRCSAVGTRALATSNGNDCTAVGYNSLVANISGTENTAMGTLSSAANTTGTGNSDYGSRSGGARTTGSFNTNVGRQAGQLLATGDSNTYIGSAAGRLRQDGTNNTAATNSTCIGASAAISGDNQVQLGNSSTTTYVYGTVQNRSDERDKFDIRDTVLGLEFIEALRPVDYRWNFREDYREVDGDGVVTHIGGHDKGTRARTRFHHGVIAQEVQAVADAAGVDFGGMQHHAAKGGEDVFSVGYDEFIAPLIKAVQELSARVKQLESERN